MVSRGRILAGTICALALSCLAMPRLAAHDVNIHRRITDAALTHFLALNPDLQACNDPRLRTILGVGVTKEDDFLPVASLPLPPFQSRSMHHFAPVLNDVVNNVSSTHVFSTCSSFSAPNEPVSEWAFDNGPCQQSIAGFDRTDTNEWRLAETVENLRALPGSPQKLLGFRGLGHVLHLLQDLSSPAHVLNDAHPPITTALIAQYGDPSKYEVFNASHQALPNRPIPALPPMSPRSAFTALRDHVRGNFLSEKDALALDPSLPTVCLDPQDPASCGYLVGPPPDNRLRAYLSRARRQPRFIIDALVADAQFSELAPLAVAYTASVLEFVHRNLAPLCEQEIRANVVGEGAVFSSPDGARDTDNNIRCGALGGVTQTPCEHSFPSGRTITLSATPDSGATFMEWSGACSGNGSCEIETDGTTPIQVTARFERPVVYSGPITLHGSPISWHGFCSFTETVSARPAPNHPRMTLNPDGTGTLNIAFAESSLTRNIAEQGCPPTLFQIGFGASISLTVDGHTVTGQRHQGDRIFTFTGTRSSDRRQVTGTLTKTYTSFSAFGGTLTGTFTLNAQ
jgi:hypothetical protein